VTTFIIVIWTAIGAALAVLVGDIVAPAFGFRHMEGMSAVFALFFAAPIGAIAGGMFGLALARKYAARQRPIARYSLLAIALVVVGGFVFERATNDMLDRYARLAFEVRLPPGRYLTDWSDVSGNIRSNGKDGSSIGSHDGGIRRDGDRVVLQGIVDVWRQTTDRALTFRIGQEPVHLFRLNVPAKPVESAAMGPWSPTDLIEDGTVSRKPNDGETFEIRYRVYY